MPSNQIIQGDCLEVLQAFADNSVDLIATDPPYFRVKGEAWDNQWANPAKFLEWIDALCVEWKRVLKPNGSLYVFASPQMSHGVEGVIRKHFNVLNNIRWQKEAGWHNKTRKEDLRSFLSPWEACIYAEHFGSDNMPKGVAGYIAKCDELRGFVFEPLRSYLADERDRAGFTTRQVAEAYQKKSGSRTVTGMAGHWFERVQWALPTIENYEWLRGLFNGASGNFLTKDHKELSAQYNFLLVDYEELRQQYEELRRPFAVTSDVPTADIWNFPAVQPYKGKHVCEKPAALMEHIIASSSRPAAVVLDCFMGSNATGKAARKLGRAYIGIELDPHWVQQAQSYREPAAQNLLQFA